MLIREASQGDITELAEMHLASWQAAYRGIVPDHIIDAKTLEQLREGWTKLLVAARCQTLVCVIKDRIAGFSHFGPSRQENAAASDAELLSIYVHPDHWRAGGGEALWEKTLEIVRKDYRTIIVWVFRDNNRARRFYEAAGFGLSAGLGKQSPWFGNAPEVCYRRELTELG